MRSTNVAENGGPENAGPENAGPSRNAASLCSSIYSEYKADISRPDE